MVFQSPLPANNTPLKDGHNGTQHGGYRHSYGSLQEIEENRLLDDNEHDSGGEESCSSDKPEAFPQPEVPPTLMKEVTDEVSVISNTINALLGVSLFAMPWGFQQSGILGGLFVLFVVSVLSYDTARMLLISQKVLYLRTGLVKNYPQIAATTLGSGFAGVVKIATITSCLGGCTGYLIFFGETVGQALSMSSEKVILLATIPLILLSWVRTFRELSFFTLLGVGSLIIAVVMILIDGSAKIDDTFNDLPLFAPTTFMNFIGPATFLFTIHYCILAMGAEALKTIPWINSMTNTEPELSFSALNYPIAISYFLSLILIALVGIAGFAMYRNVDLVTDRSGHLLTGCEGHVCQNVLLNLSPGHVRNVIGITMSIVIILSYVLVLVPAREHIEHFLLHKFKLAHHNDRAEYITANVIRTILVLITVMVALKFPYFGTVMGAVGGLTDAFQCFVLPPLIYLQIEGDKFSSYYQTYHFCIVFWGVATIIYTAYNAFYELN